MSVAIVIPWRATNRDREIALEHVITALAAILPGAELYLTDSSHERFNRAAARNAGVLRAAAEGANVVVVCDADTIPEAAPLLEAIDQAARDGALHWPFVDFRALSPEGTQDFYGGTPVQGCRTEYECLGSQGGVLVCTPSVWFAAGGMDERFTGWGFEDTAFSVAVRTLVAEAVRHPGAIHHLWHPSEMDMTSRTYQANRALCEQYERAFLDPEAMRAVQRGVEALRG